MIRTRFDNFLRTFRRKAGFTHPEMAFLFGCHDPAQMSRYERGHRLPTLRHALAYHVILGPAVEVLFTGVWDDVKLEARDRLQQLRAGLLAKREKGHKLQITSKKIAWIDHQLAEIT